MDKKKYKSLVVAGSLFVGVIMVLGYAYLIGFDCISASGEYQNVGFSIEQWRRNCPHLISYTLLFVVPIIVPWVILFIQKPQTWLKYWLYGLLYYGIPLVICLPIAASIHPDYMTIDVMYGRESHFPNPFVLSDQLFICSFIYFLLFISYIQLQWWCNCRQQKKTDYIYYFLIAIVVPLAAMLPSLLGSRHAESDLLDSLDWTLLLIVASLLIHLVVLGCIKILKHYWCPIKA